MVRTLWPWWADQVARHAGKLVAAGLALLVLALPWAAQLYGNLHTDLRELLPQGAPAAVALDELEHRIGGVSSLTLVVQTADPEQGKRYVDALATQVRKLPKDLVARVDADLRQERAFAQAHGALYANTADLQVIADGLQKRRDEARQKANPFHVDIDDSPPPPAPTQPDELDAAVVRLRDQAKQAEPFPSGYMASADGKTLIVHVKPAGAAVGLDAAQRLFGEVDGIVVRLRATFPGVTVGYTGELRGLIEAQEHLMRDMLHTTVLVLVSVAVALLLYFGHLRSLPQLILPLFIGAAATFAIARHVIVYLNPNTAFLGSIIAGNGINAGIILLGRYDELRRGGMERRPAWGDALASTWVGTATASGAAALAYGALGTMQFRGFNQFGFIGLVGMVACWVSTYAFLPPVTELLERWRPNRYGRWSEPLRLTTWLADSVTGRPKLAVTAGVFLAVAAGAGVWQFAQAPIEHDLQNLGSAQGRIDGEAYWSRKVDAVMRSYQTPTVVLTDSPEQAEQVAKAVRAAKEAQGAASTIDNVRTLHDVLPTDQTARLALVQRILELVKPSGGTVGQIDKKLLERIRPDLRGEVQNLVEKTQVSRVTAADLPERWGAAFREKTNTCQGCIALVYPTLATDSKHGEAQDEHARTLREAVAESVPQARVAGTLVLIADINRAITVDGRGATLLSFVAVALATLLILRSFGASLWVLGSLAMGVLWMFGALGWLGVKLNFVNFAAMPITFGIGVDYAVNYVQRYRHDGDANAALRSVGGAVALCSATTILGYATLVIADNLAVRSFGIAAVLGELTCLSAALLLTPAGLAWRDRRAQRQTTPTANLAAATAKD